MKKLFIKLAVAALVLGAALVLSLTLFLDKAVKAGIETVGPQLTKTSLQLAGVKISLLSGKGEIRGLVMGNPEGYKTDSAIRLGKASLRLAPASLLSDKVVIRSFVAQAPEITFEGWFKENNLGRILDNVKSVTKGTTKERTRKPAPTPETRPESGEPGQTKLQVDEFLLSGAKLHVSLKGMGGQAMVLALPDIELRNLGQDEEGITVAELVRLVLNQVSQSSAKVVADSSVDLGKGAVGAAIEGIGTGSAEGVEKAVKGISDLFKKKE